MSFQYTSSPLGIISDLKGYDTSGTSLNSIFTNQNKYYKFKGGGINKGILSTIGSIHSDDIYDASTEKIIDKFSGIDHLSLKWADFAYMKDYGLYPNNRLIVLRRFAMPIIDDIYSVSSTDGPGSPISTVLGYIDGDKDFFSINFSEKWSDADASFKEILNQISGDFAMKQFKMGDILEQGANAIPLPGASLLFQRQLLQNLGLLSSEGIANIPVGSPNLIKDGKVRTLLADDTPGSGLNGKLNINFNITYEQKFFNGVDPTLVYLDILGVLLSMGTSKSTFYLGRGDSKLQGFINDMIKDPMEALIKFITAAIKAFGGAITKLVDSIKGAVSSQGEGDEEDEPKEDISGLAGLTVDKVTKYISDFITDKYRVRALGVMASLTGGPSTPWHITIGNPFRPIICSGDMLVKDIQITLGPQLSFNDLPTFIKATISLESARDQGLQEIFSKFNSGGIRTVKGKGNISDVEEDYDGYLIQPNSNRKKGDRYKNFWSERRITKDSSVGDEGSAAAQIDAGATAISNQSKAGTQNNEKINKDSQSSNPLIANNTPQSGFEPDFVSGQKV